MLTMFPVLKSGRDNLYILAPCANANRLQIESASLQFKAKGPFEPYLSSSPQISDTVHNMVSYLKISCASLCTISISLSTENSTESPFR